MDQPTATDILIGECEFAGDFYVRADRGDPDGPFGSAELAVAFALGRMGADAARARDIATTLVAEAIVMSSGELYVPETRVRLRIAA